VHVLEGTFWMIAGNALSRYLSEGRAATCTNGGMGLLIIAAAALIP
jgi:hypothetical protein